MQNKTQKKNAEEDTGKVGQKRKKKKKKNGRTMKKHK